MCNHDLAEMETSCADGYCPLCLTEKVKRLENEIKELKKDRLSVSDKLYT